jgi:hypothetical protein
MPSAEEPAGPPRHYVRTGGGQEIHRAGCFAALGGAPWEWAEGMSAIELATDATAGRYRQCEFCMPEDMWPAEEEVDDDDPGGDRG